MELQRRNPFKRGVVCCLGVTNSVSSVENKIAKAVQLVLLDLCNSV